jgi:hypothetical protein
MDFEQDTPGRPLRITNITLLVFTTIYFIGLIAISQTTSGFVHNSSILRFFASNTTAIILALLLILNSAKEFYVKIFRTKLLTNTILFFITFAVTAGLIWMIFAPSYFG